MEKQIQSLPNISFLLLSTGLNWFHVIPSGLSFSLLDSRYVLNKTTLVPTSLESFFQSVSIGLLRTQSGSRSNRSLTSLPDISWFLYKVSCRFFNRNNIVTDHPSEIPRLPFQHSMYGEYCYPCHLRENLKSSIMMTRYDDEMMMRDLNALGSEHA